MSASIVAERSSLRNRGRMLGWIFSNQGWVSRSAVSTMIVSKVSREHSLARLSHSCFSAASAKR